MKTLELNNLPTPVLLAWGLPEDACFITMAYPAKSLYYSENDASEWARIAKGNWQLIGKLSELTEEQAHPLVHSFTQTDTDKNSWTVFRDYRDNGSLPNALASFKSSIKSAGYYFQNPLGKRYDPSICVKKPEYRQEQTFNEYDEELRKAYSKAWSDWNEAQSKTVPANTLIFKRV